MALEQARERHVHGRRRGKRLTARRQRLVDELLPSLVLPAGGASLDALALFGDSRPLWLEIGFGGGEHLAWQARHHRDIGFLGAEPFINGVASLLAAVEDDDLVNVRIEADNIVPVLERLAPASLARVFVLFPDPWPKARHHRRRFASAENLALLYRAMAPGAELRLATDIPDYAAHALEAVAASPGFQVVPGAPEAAWPGWPGTRYEAKARAAGRRPQYLTFRRD